MDDHRGNRRGIGGRMGDCRLHRPFGASMIRDLTIIALVAAGFAAIAIGPYVYSLATIAQVIGNA